MPLGELLRRLKILASRLRLPELDSWVENELSGYQDVQSLPSYRGPFKATVLGHFGGPFGSGLENAPIPPLNFKKEYRDGALFTLVFLQPIAELESMKSAKKLTEPWPSDALVLVNYMLQNGELRLYEGMGLRQAWKVIGPTAIPGLLDAVRNRVLDFLLRLEEIAPNAGENDDAPPHGQVLQVFNNTFHGGTNIAVGGHNIQQNATFPPSGDVDGLLSWLREHGVPEDEVEALDNALAEDMADAHTSPESPGPRVSAWLGRVMMREGVAIGTGTTAGVVTELIKHFFH